MSRRVDASSSERAPFLMRCVLSLCLVALVGAIGCGDTEEEPDADPQPDMMPDAEAAPDPQPDMMPDAEAAPDPQPDMEPNMEAAPDPQPDMTPDAEAAPDPQPDMTPDAMPDMEPEPEPDMMVDLLECDVETLNPTEFEQLGESLEAWLALKAQNGKNYTYDRTTSSFTGFRTITEFDVVDDVVVARRFEAFDEGNNMVESYSEEGDEVGNSNQGHPPLLVEALYTACACEVLTQSPEDNFINLSLHDNALMRNCTFFPRNCADDCDQGVDINSLSFNQ